MSDPAATGGVGLAATAAGLASLVAMINLLIANYAAAYGAAERDEIAGTTAILNTVQRVFSAAGVAVFIGILQARAPDLTHGVAARGPLVDAFAYTFIWVGAIAARTVVPALLLPRRRAAVAAPVEAVA